MLKKIINYCLWTLLFLLPWQTRWIYDPRYLNGDYWEYGTASFYGTEILLWITVILFSIFLFRQRDFWRRVTDKNRFNNQHWSLLLGLLVIAFFLFSIGKSTTLDISYNHFLWILGGFCIGVVMIMSWDNKEKYWYYGLVAFWSGALVQGIFAIWQFITQFVPANKWLGLASHYPWELGASVIETTSGRYLRAYGSLGGPNPLGTYLAVALIIGLVLYLAVKEWRYKILIAAGQVVILFGLFLSFSRGAWIAVVLGIMAMWLVLIKSHRDCLKSFGRQIFYYIVLVGVLAVSFWPLLSVRMTASSRLEAKSLSERQIQISDAVDIFSAHPWFGVGEGAYTYELYLRHGNLSGGSYQPAHNIYLLILVEWGVIGSALFLSLCVWLFKKIFFNNILMVPAVIVLVVASVFDHWTWSIFSGVLFWWLVWTFGTVRLEK